MEKYEQVKINKRPAKPEDTEFARRAHHAGYHDVVINQFGKWDRQAQDNFFEAGWKNSLGHEIIMCNGKPCGYTSSEEIDGVINFHELVILPEFQRRGIGTKILDEKIKMAKKKRITLKFQVLKANKAISLYKRLGAEKVGETKTHLIMEFKPE
jgi:ribosomal protein S18 acetylase RimI-like enzyme